MEIFEILVIMLGIASGALLPMLPQPGADKKPLGAILGFSLVFALWVTFSPVITLSPRFLSTMLISLVGAVAGFYGMYSARAPREEKLYRAKEIHQSA